MKFDILNWNEPAMYLDSRSPEQNGSSPKSLNQRVQKCLDKKKPKLKQNLIRSQFSCTYKDDAATQIKPLAFPSMSQVPTCIHPALKIVPVLCFDDDAIPTGDVPKEKISLQINSGNRDPIVVKAKAKKAPLRKSTKRKQFDNGANQNDLDDEPAQKKTAPPNKSKEMASMAKKNSKSAAKTQIAGQAKLTSFFRL
ncbi:unnamed protein product [Ranitomeya imitator]|uniref:PCNA-interacting partner n=1 Tax=Ranitomeya imitator TaxID=111125 RepID=A0ABN9LFX1_9NEOB|nr:unnamed protein product [Ranitomeya imitator]